MEIKEKYGITHSMTPEHISTMIKDHVFIIYHDYILITETYTVNENSKNK